MWPADRGSNNRGTMSEKLALHREGQGARGSTTGVGERKGIEGAQKGDRKKY